MLSFFFLIANLYVFSSKEEILLKKIGERIKILRLKNNLTQAQIAFELGTSTKHYQRIEYGQINTGILNLFKLCEIFDVEIEFILKEVNL